MPTKIFTPSPEQTDLNKRLEVLLALNSGFVVEGIGLEKDDALNRAADSLFYLAMESEAVVFYQAGESPYPVRFVYLTHEQAEKAIQVGQQDEVKTIMERDRVSIELKVVPASPASWHVKERLSAPSSKRMFTEPAINIFSSSFDPPSSFLDQLPDVKFTWELLSSTLPLPLLGLFSSSDVGRRIPNTLPGLSIETTQQVLTSLAVSAGGAATASTSSTQHPVPSTSQQSSSQPLPAENDDHSASIQSTSAGGSFGTQVVDHHSSAHTDEDGDITLSDSIGDETLVDVDVDAIELMKEDQVAIAVDAEVGTDSTATQAGSQPDDQIDVQSVAIALKDVEVETDNLQQEDVGVGTDDLQHRDQTTQTDAPPAQLATTSSAISVPPKAAKGYRRSLHHLITPHIDGSSKRKEDYVVVMVHKVPAEMVRNIRSFHSFITPAGKYAFAGTPDNFLIEANTLLVTYEGVGAQSGARLLESINRSTKTIGMTATVYDAVGSIQVQVEWEDPGRRIEQHDVFEFALQAELRTGYRPTSLVNLNYELVLLYESDFGTNAVVTVMRNFVPRGAGMAWIVKATTDVYDFCPRSFRTKT